MTPALDPHTRRALVVVPAVIALLAMLGPFSIDTPFPAFGQMGERLDASSAQMQWVVTAYMGSFAAMSIFHGPLSDALGRKPVILGGLAVFTVGSVGAALAPSLEVLLGFRVLQGVSAGAATIVSRTIVRDLYDGDQAQVLMSRVSMIFGLAPAVAPVIGGGVLQLGDWTGIFWFMAFLGVALAACTVLLLPESHPQHRRTPMHPGRILRGLADVAVLPAFHRLAWAATFAFAAQFLYIGGAAIFVVDLLGQGELDFWKLFVPMIGSMIVGSWITGRAAGRISSRRLVTAGFTVALAGGVLGLALSASPLGDRLPWAVVGCSVLALGNGIIYPMLQLMLLDLFPERRGAVASGGTFVTLMLNALLAVTVSPHVGSTLGFAIAAVTLVAAGHLLWTWHCAVADAGVRAEADRAAAAPAGSPEGCEPTDLV